MHVPTCLPLVKLKIWCAHNVAHNFGMQMTASECMQYMSDTDYELALVLPHHTCSAQVQ